MVGPCAWRWGSRRTRRGGWGCRLSLFRGNSFLWFCLHRCCCRPLKPTRLCRPASRCPKRSQDSSFQSPRTYVITLHHLSPSLDIGNWMVWWLLLRLKIGLKCEERLLDIRGNNAQQSHSLNVLQVAGLLAALLELERVEGLVELVDLGFDLWAGEDCHVVVKSYPVQLHLNNHGLGGIRRGDQNWLFFRDWKVFTIS